MVMALGVVAMLSACGGNGGSSDINQTIPITTKEILPTCSIAEGVPLTNSQLTVHIVCKGGNINIDQATVTVDGQLKNLDFTGSSINDYIGFRNLQGNKVYKAELEVIVGGETLTDSVSIRTKKTPTPSPTPVNTTPVSTPTMKTPTPSPTPVNKTPVSTPTIAMASQTVNDNGGAISTALPAPTVTGVVAGAVYSIVSDPTGGMLTIDSSTGAMSWFGNLFSDTTYSIDIKVTNTDGGTATATFSLTVINNG